MIEPRDRFVYGIFEIEDGQETPCYIGMGSEVRMYSHIKRARSGNLADRLFKDLYMYDAVKRGVEFTQRKIIENLTYAEALEHETQLIKEIGCIEYGTGPLLNIRGGLTEAIIKQRRQAWELKRQKEKDACKLLRQQKKEARELEKQKNRKPRGRPLCVYLDTPLGRMSRKEAAQAFGISEDTLRDRITHCVPQERLFDPPSLIRGRPFERGNKSNTGKSPSQETRFKLSAATTAYYEKLRASYREAAE